MELCYKYNSIERISILDNNALKLASIRCSFPINDYETFSVEGVMLLYPITDQGERIIVTDNAEINIDHLQSSVILGTDPCIIPAVMSLFSDGIIPSNCLENFLVTLQDEVYAAPFQRIRDVFLCTDMLVADLIGAKMFELKYAELWSSYVMEYDPAYKENVDVAASISHFINTWFLESTCIVGTMNAGTSIAWFLFRKNDRIPHLMIDNTTNFILDNYRRDIPRIPLSYKYITTNYFDIRFRYAATYCLRKKIYMSDLYSNGACIYYQVDAKHPSDLIELTPLDVDSIIGRVQVIPMKNLEEAIQHRWNLKDLFQTFIVPSHDIYYLVVDGYIATLPPIVHHYQITQWLMMMMGNKEYNNKEISLMTLITNINEDALFGYVDLFGVRGLLD